MKNTFVKVLSFVMALMMVVGTFGTLAVFAAEHEHTKGDLVKTEPATCVKSGYSVYKCADPACGKEFVPADSVVLADAKYHKVESVPAKDATCLADATTAGKKCTNEGCNYIPENAGVQTLTGTQKEHAFKRVETAATCTAAQKIEYVCKTCNLTAEKINEKVLKSETKWVGTQTYETFKKLEGAADNLNAAIDPTHATAKWVVVTEPKMENGKCTDGLMRATCEKCNYVAEKKIPVAHNFTTNLNPTGSLCAEYVKDTKACSVCGMVQPGAVKTENRTNHKNSGNKVYTGTYTSGADLPVKADGETKFTIAELLALGFEAGKPFYKAATCTAAGYALTECVCGEIYVDVLPVNTDAHKDENLNKGAIQWPTACNKPAVVIGKCKTAGCNYEKTFVVAEAAATAHKLDVKVTNPDCDDFGYTTSACTNTFTANGVTYTCSEGRDANGQPVKHTYVDPVGCKYGAPYWVSGECGSASVVYNKKCTVCNTAVAATEPAGTQHKFVETEVAATCMKVNYKTKVCSICKKGEGEEIAVANAAVNPANHVYYGADGKALNVVTVTVQPSCTAEGQQVIQCNNPACKNTSITVVAPKTPHTEATGSKVTKNGSTWVVTAAETPATCLAVGYKADGKFCTNCGAQTKAPTQIDINPNAHSNMVLIPGDTTTATCKKNGTLTYSTTCHGIVTMDNPDDPKKTSCNFVFVGFKAPTCTEAGWHGHKECSYADCKAYENWTVVTTGCTLNCANHANIDNKLDNTVVIPALGHDWVKVDGQAETCTELGAKEYYDCSRCDLVTFDKAKTYNTTVTAENNAFLAAKEILPHGNSYKQRFTAKAATCVATGIKAEKDNGDAWCTKCDVTNGVGNWVIPTTTHTWSTTEINASNAPDYDCTLDYCKVTACTVCNTVQENGYTFIKSTHSAHNLPSTWTEVPDDKPNCKNPVMESISCQNANCSYSNTRKKSEATGCWTTKGAVAVDAERFPIDYTCNKIAEFVGYTCGDCGTTITADMADHTKGMVSVDKDPTCDEDGYHIEFCSICNSADKVVNDKLDKLNAEGKHTYSASSIIIDYKPATATEAGYIVYECDVCHEHDTKVIDATATLAIAGTLSAETIASGAKVVYTVQFSGAAYEFSTLKINVSYNDDLFTFVSASTGLAGANVYTSVNEDGDLGISLVVPYSATGEAQKVSTTAEGTDVVVLTFVAKDYVSGTASFDVAKINDATATCEADTLAIVGKGDMDGKNGINAEDAAAISKWFAEDAEYDETVDFNKDGIIDIDDLALIATFAASKQTAKDYLVMMGTYAEVEATINALFESGDLLDCNKDGFVNVNDKMLLTMKVDNTLTTKGYMQIDFASVEEFVVATMVSFISTPVAP